MCFESCPRTNYAKQVTLQFPFNIYIISTNCFWAPATAAECIGLAIRSKLNKLHPSLNTFPKTKSENIPLFLHKN